MKAATSRSPSSRSSARVASACSSAAISGPLSSRSSARAVSSGEYEAGRVVAVEIKRLRKVFRSYVAGAPREDGAAESEGPADRQRELGESAEALLDVRTQLVQRVVISLRRASSIAGNC